MPLDRLAIQGLRNLAALDIRPSPGINLILGANGSGKTSLLEGIHVLGLGRSFRTHRLKHVIAHQGDSLTLYGRVAGDPPVPLGVRRDRQAQELEMRVAGERIARTASLAEALPLQLINPDTFRLLEGAPRARREFLDWGVFHVKREFFDVWRRVRQALKHRNALLRHDRIDARSLDIWDQELIYWSESLDQLRENYFESFIPVFEETLSELLSASGLELRYSRGWDRERSFAEVLQQGRQSDRQMGFTQQGPQRADLRIRLHRRPAVEVLSRGQQKLVVSALKLAQGRLLENTTARTCLYLIDDLPAELDGQHRLRFCRWLERMDCQVFVTSVESQALSGMWQSHTPVSMFHVKHGVLETVDARDGRTGIDTNITTTDMNTE